ncbi:type I pantothenate kinase [Sphingomonas nostoxanthinifaciens]|uniref:type I pantothenate kinase n=1 Tax=Sphingomonas nostoxanthinifaciens TaxID=2872652 RepID=UPI001CC20BD0|nr:type I pantothenate kinase [Sphingomonas nostoxanthinifaciens]UAK23470.1 type I pantothenate kinase [Sphingomonas nostoxanthinifaciens]
MAKPDSRSRIDRAAPASVVAGKFGGLSRLSAAIGKSPSTVHRWLVKGHIDGNYHAEILAAAQVPGNLVAGAVLAPLDFVDTRQADAPAASASLSETVGDVEVSHTHFTRRAWAQLRSAVPMTLDEAALAQLRGTNEPTSLIEVEEIYLPLTRLINLHVRAAQGLARVTDDFVGRVPIKRPYVVAIAGSVAVGKSTTARLLRALLSRWPDHPHVELVTTDGFLHPNKVLEERGLMERKGFPESYDVRRMIRFLADIRSTGRAEAPVYSHHIYDIVPGTVTIDRPDILIFEGLNVLQIGAGPDAPRAAFTASDFFDLGIYIDAAPDDVASWFEQRFRLLRETAFTDPHAFFHPLAMMPEEEALGIARRIWREVNQVNLIENILPTRPRADVIVRKGPEHRIDNLWLRKL